jgi:cellulose synthase/poly-beta-1,6-N-acetylglucosamine synthase-like glycosyltransferase
MKAKIAAIIPAKNEEGSIQACVESLTKQTYPLDLILIVNDGSTDGTEMVLEELAGRYPNVRYININQPHLKAGALNEGIRTLAKLKEFDFVLIGDADTYFYPDLVERAAKMMESDSKIGGICSISAPKSPPKEASFWARVLCRLQKLEYGEFTAERVRRWKNVLIMPGLCSLFRFSALMKVGGYTEGILLEDYDMTLKLKEAGYKTVFSPQIRAETEPPLSLRRILLQRTRWFRGGLEILKLHGINRFTLGDFLEHLLFGLLLFLILVSTIAGITVLHNRHPLSRFSWTSPVTIVSFLLAFLAIGGSFYRISSVYKRDRIDILLKLLILPEFIYGIVIYFFIRLYGYFLFFFSKSKKW